MTSTIHRVPLHTASGVNARIRARTDERVMHLARSGTGLEERLRQLDKEWDVERLLETNASAIAFAGVMLGAFVDRMWLILPALVTGFLFQHAVQGWCPPLPVLRRLGFRTSREIEIERNALKTLRGDYASPQTDLAPEEKARLALSAARL
ncbi:MAG: hypothetical protein RJB58_281 [Pseudomonadota bacterium]|jgi:hypothetical protein